MSEYDKPSLVAVDGSNVTPLLTSERAMGEDAHALLEAVAAARRNVSRARLDASRLQRRARREGDCMVQEAKEELQRAVLEASLAGLSDQVYDLDPEFSELMAINAAFDRLDD